jgi:hypothetical protein
MAKTHNDEDRQTLNRKFFEAMDTLLREKKSSVDEARLRFRGRYPNIQQQNIGIRYTLSDGIMWEPFHDRKNDVHGWRPMRWHRLSDLIHQIKYGHDRDFVTDLPEKDISPGDPLDNLWAWTENLKPCVHVLMLQQDYQKFIAFVAFVNAQHRRIENGTLFVEIAQSFNQQHDFDAYNYGLAWQDISRIHGEIMRKMKSLEA